MNIHTLRVGDFDLAHFQYSVVKEPGPVSRNSEPLGGWNWAEDGTREQKRQQILSMISMR